MEAYLKLGLAALLPALFAVVFRLLEKKTAFSSWKEPLKQAVIGIVFGGLAVIGTEFGIPIEGAQVNCRDAAVMTAGLMFGAPAGILAGLIGGIERWCSVWWGVPAFTRIACSVSTILAGVYSALLRKYMFEDKKPGAVISFAVGIVMETFHLTMVFLTNMNTPQEAMRVVKVCTAPMLIANGLSLFLAALFLTLLSDGKGKGKETEARIAQTVQKWLLLTVLLAFFFTSIFIFSLQTRIAAVDTDSDLENAVRGVAADILDASDKNLLSLTRKIEGRLSFGSLDKTAEQYDVAEISVVDRNGIITDSSVPEYVGFDFYSGEQSREFLCLLSGTEEYVQKYGPISFDGSTMRKYAGVRTDTGFLQIGYDAETFQRDLASQVAGVTKNRSVGSTGYVLIFDGDHKVVSSPAGFDGEAFLKQTAGKTLPEEQTTFEMEVGGEACFCRYMTSEGYYIMSVLPREEALQMRNIVLYVNTYMEILVFAVLFGLIYLLIKRVVVSKITQINGSLARITGGDLDEVVNVRSSVEFASLSDDINSTVDTLKRYITEASARIDKELKYARDIQSSALPDDFPAFPKHTDFDIYARMDPAKEVGGDFYDFYMTPDGKLNFLIADVSGKGIPAAMFMMRAKTELKSLTEAGNPLADVFTRGNEALCEGNDAGVFVTAWQGGLDLKTGRVEFVNAGHNPPLLGRGGKFDYQRSRTGFILAGMEGVPYRVQGIDLQKGDVLFLYTDGVTEAQNEKGEFFGEERLLEALNGAEYADMAELCAKVQEKVESFVDGAAQFDDITMVALRYIGTPEYGMVLEEAKLEDVEAVQAFLEEGMEQLGASVKAIRQIGIAADEILTNIVSYGYAGKPGRVLVSLFPETGKGRLAIRFTDEGIPYNPLKKEDPDITLSADERQVGGLGIFMVKKLTDDVKYEYENGKNVLTVYKNL